MYSLCKLVKIKEIQKLKNKSRAKKRRRAYGEEEWKGYVGNRFIYNLWEQGQKANMDLQKRFPERKGILKAVPYQLSCSDSGALLELCGAEMRQV